MGLTRAALSLAVLAATALLPSCAVEAEPPVVGGYATVYATEVPPDVYAYLLRSEPPGLYRYRMGYGQGRYYGGYPRYDQRPGYYRQPGVNVAPPAAPPAQRVR